MSHRRRACMDSLCITVRWMCCCHFFLKFDIWYFSRCCVSGAHRNGGNSVIFPSLFPSLCLSPGSSNTFSFLLISLVLISVAAATLRLPPLIPRLSELLVKCGRAGQWFVFYSYFSSRRTLSMGPHMSCFLSTVSSFHVFLAYLFGMILFLLIIHVCYLFV